MTDEVAHADEYPRRNRQLLMPGLEHGNHLRHDVGQQKRDDGELQHEEYDRVDQGIADLLAHDLPRLGVIREPLQHRSSLPDCSPADTVAR